MTSATNQPSLCLIKVLLTMMVFDSLCKCVLHEIKLLSMRKNLKPNSLFFSVNKEENDFNPYAEIRIFYAFIDLNVILIRNGVKCLKYTMDALLSNNIM